MAAFEKPFASSRANSRENTAIKKQPENNLFQGNFTAVLILNLLTRFSCYEFWEPAVYLISIFFVSFGFSAFGIVTFKMPSLYSAAISAGLTFSGTSKVRRNEPYFLSL